MTDAVLANAVVIGTNDFPHLTRGWHARETDGRCGVAFRACKGTGALRLAAPVGAKSVHLLLSGPRGLCQGALRGTAAVNGTPHELDLDADLWVMRSFPLSPAAEVEVELLLNDAPCPDEVLGNGDGRRLGWFLAAAWVE
ncbi:MAG: hypothetical protein PWP23_2063 [Candidatus Sumerlaeota bacterium]|nr:hypothetical protein [Candidatus Sumerlaeota bacterium]